MDFVPPSPRFNVPDTRQYEAGLNRNQDSIIKKCLGYFTYISSFIWKSTSMKSGKIQLPVEFF